MRVNHFHDHFNETSPNFLSFLKIFSKFSCLCLALDGKFQQKFHTRVLPLKHFAFIVF
jgi:hypothetical protein